MAFSSLPFALLLVMALAMSQSIQAQNSAQDFLTPHNAARAQVGVGPMTWDTGVEAYAMNYANQRKGDCALKHSNGPYGENLFWGSGGGWSAADAVKSWVDEKNNYNYAANTCAAGKVCGHYTQVVWRNSVRLGCARVKCDNGGIFIACNYSPRGNYAGQKPYQNSTSIRRNSTASAQNSTGEFLALHNAARAAVGVGSMTWDTRVEVYAINYANQRKSDCAFQHSGGPYGENIFWGSGGDWSAAAAVKSWVVEKTDYNYDTNTCAAGKVCEHYTQVVWNNSLRLGCACVKCDNGGSFITCNYDPPGNYAGQKPYHNSTSIRRDSTASAQSSTEEFLTLHNAARAQVGVGPMTWDTGVEAYAFDYASQRMGDCRLQHSGGPYGENLFRGSNDSFTAADSVNMWVEEKNDYDYVTNTCAAGKVCGNYTQVVWSNSLRLGCARVKCNNGGIFITCNYDPPGNYVGQKPYPNSTSIRQPFQGSTGFVIMLLSA